MHLPLHGPVVCLSRRLQVCVVALGLSLFGLVVRKTDRNPRPVSIEKLEGLGLTVPIESSGVHFRLEAAEKWSLPPPCYHPLCLAFVSPSTAIADNPWILVMHTTDHLMGDNRSHGMVPRCPLKFTSTALSPA